MEHVDWVTAGFQMAIGFIILAVTVSCLVRVIGELKSPPAQTATRLPDSVGRCALAANEEVAS